MRGVDDGKKQAGKIPALFFVMNYSEPKNPPL